MFKALIHKIIGTQNERYIKRLQPLVASINALEGQMRALKDDEFQPKIRTWTEMVADRACTIDDLLPECFALVREASRRVLNMRHFDVQLIGGIALHEGRIAEMKTGEGKTLVATLPVVLNALTKRGVHVVTVNDYLARRDSAWMGKLYNFLGLSVGCILHGLEDEERQRNYAADITYGTNNEFGFDYLRDNMKFYAHQLVQRPLNFAIVDEVDSILIDEARTPLIISGLAEDSTTLYKRINAMLPGLKRDKHFTIDEKTKSVNLTDEGVNKCEEVLNLENLFDARNIHFQHHVLQGLKAHHCFHRDVDYIVAEEKVVIVDEFTGRLMPGRRYSDGLHQALEAKENVKVEAENQTLASITFQNYFRMYEKLGGMTGTADTEAVEFKEIYNLEVVVIPTNQPMVRNDMPDLVYKTRNEKYKAIAEQIAELHKKGQPVLVGTVSIEKSEIVSALLTRLRVPHEVLNAKHHEKEAEIVALAGHRGHVTIATNMAGRGTDIVLGEGVRELGGLFVLGTERHESRRIDNQLRGRSGRQGDPGASRFYLSLEDDLMRLFGSDRIATLMDKLGMEEGEPIENRMVSRAIESAQRRVEAHNFDIRKQLLEYDNVMNQQREVIYGQRRELMTTDRIDEFVTEFVNDLLTDDVYAPVGGAREITEEQRDLVHARLLEVFNIAVDSTDGTLMPREKANEIIDGILNNLRTSAGEHYIGITRYFILESLDRCWKEHLLNMDHLKEGIGLRGYGQKDPKQEYAREGFALFEDMFYRIKENTMKNLCRLRLQVVREEEFQHKDDAHNVSYSGGAEVESKSKPVTVKRDAPKVGRNDLCPCGSGKKYKKCCGA